MTKLLGEVRSQRLLKLFRERRYRELNSEISTLTKRFPNDFFLHNLGGIVAAQTQLNDRAIKYLKRATSIKPEASEPFINMGYLSLNIKKPKEALDAFLRAQSLDQKNVEAQMKILGGWSGLDKDLVWNWINKKFADCKNSSQSINHRV